LGGTNKPAHRGRDKRGGTQGLEKFPMGKCVKEGTSRKHILDPEKKQGRRDERTIEEKKTPYKEARKRGKKPQL